MFKIKTENTVILLWTLLTHYKDLTQHDHYHVRKENTTTTVSILQQEEATDNDYLFIFI